MNEWHPHDIDLEKNVLGSLITSIDTLNDCIGIAFIDLFYLDQHKAIFESISHIYSKGGKIDTMTVIHRLREIERLEFIGGVHYIAELTSDAITSNNEFHIRILTQLWIKRQHIIIGQRAINEASDLSADVFESTETIENSLQDINKHIIGKEFQSDIKTEIETVYKQMTGPINERNTGIKTGNGKLTNFLGGFNKKELIIIAARPSMGKTTRAIQFALQAAFDNKKVGIFSIEMSKDEIFKKMLLNISGLEANTVREQSWTHDELELYTQAKEKIKYSNLFICDMGILRPSLLRTIARQKKKQYGLDMIIIDYLQMMKPDRDMQNRQNDISTVSTELKILAKDLDIPVIALSQLSRECEKRGNKRPMLSDLRDSGQIEQDADIVLSMYSPAFYGPDSSYSGLSDEQYNQVSEMAILKNRNGLAGVIIQEQFIKSKSLFV